MYFVNMGFQKLHDNTCGRECPRGTTVLLVLNAMDFVGPFHSGVELVRDDLVLVHMNWVHFSDRLLWWKSAQSVLDAVLEGHTP